MSSRYKVYHDYIPHFITVTVVGWIDALSRPDYKDIVIASLNYCIGHKSLQLHAWVIMNNHLHLIVSAQEDKKLSDIIRDFKKYTSNQVIKCIKEHPSESRKEWMLNMFAYAGRGNSSNEHYQFWQQDYHPVELSNETIFKQRMDYLHDNPVRAGIVYDASHYKYSSASDYYENRKGILPLSML